MRRINRYLIYIFGISIIATMLLRVFFEKLLPPIIYNSSHYCSSLIQSAAFHVPHAIRFIPIIIGLIMGGFVTVTFSLMILQFVLLKQRINKAYPLPKSFDFLLNKLGLKSKVFIINDPKPNAFCTGLRNPKIYISKALLDLVSLRELEAIFIHERSHLRRNDTRLTVLFSIVKALFPFFPYLTDIVAHYRIEREIIADKDVTSELSNANSLLSVLKKLLIFDMSQSYLAPNLINQDSIEPRINALLHLHLKKQPINFARLLVSILSLITLLTIVLSPIQAVEIHDKKIDTMVIYLNSNRYSSMCLGPNNISLPSFPYIR